MRLLIRRRQISEAPGGIPSNGAVNGSVLLKRKTGLIQPRLAFKSAFTTVDIHEGCLRFVVFQGKKVLRWGTIAIEDTIEAGRLRGVVKGLQLSSKAILSISMDSALMRRLDLSRIKGRYVGQVVSSEVAEGVPFGPGEMDVRWSTRNKSVRQEVVAVAMATGTVDGYLQPLKASGLRLYAMYPRAMALAYVAGKGNALAVELGHHLAEMVLIEDGVPRLVHQTELGREDPDPEAALGPLLTTLEEMASWHEGMKEDHTGPLPVFITGRSRTGLGDDLARRLGRVVLGIDRRLEYPEHFPVHEYAVNLGLMLAHLDRPQLLKRGSQGPVAYVNALPERHRAKGLPVLPTGVFLALTLLAYAAFGFQGKVEESKARVALLSDRLAALQPRERNQRLEKAQQESALKRDQTSAEMAGRLATRLSQMGDQMGEVLADLQRVPNEALSARVEVSNLSFSAEGITITGSALSHTNVIDYAARLRGTGVFQDVGIVSIQARSPSSDSEGVVATPGGLLNFQIKTSHPLPIEEETKPPGPS